MPGAGGVAEVKYGDCPSLATVYEFWFWLGPELL